MNFSDLTWACHACHEERPDRFISVLTTPLPGKLGEWGGTQNVRYCNDRPACIKDAHNIDFMKGKG